MNSLQLDLVNNNDGTYSWDLNITNGSLTVVTDNTALAQNVATALGTFQGELWYDNTYGMPYIDGTMPGQASNPQNQGIFGRGQIAFSFLKAKISALARSVSGIASAIVYLSGSNNRTITGQVQLTASNGQAVGTIVTTNLAGALPWYVLGATYTTRPD